MLFNSFPFLIFFTGVTIAFYAINYNWRWLLLLVASCFFYAYLIPAYLLVLFLIIGIDYVAGRMIESNEGMARRFYLGLSILSNLMRTRLVQIPRFLCRKYKPAFGNPFIFYLEMGSSGGTFISHIPGHVVYDRGI